MIKATISEYLYLRHSAVPLPSIPLLSPHNNSVTSFGPHFIDEAPCCSESLSNLSKCLQLQSSRPCINPDPKLPLLLSKCWFQSYASTEHFIVQERRSFGQRSFLRSTLPHKLAFVHCSLGAELSLKRSQGPSESWPPPSTLSSGMWKWYMWEQPAPLYLGRALFMGGHDAREKGCQKVLRLLCIQEMGPGWANRSVYKQDTCKHRRGRKVYRFCLLLDDTTFMAESEELKILLMKVKEESEKVGLKLNIQKTKIMASSPITSWQIDGETMETVADFILGGSKITADGDCSHEIKRHLLLGRKVMTNLNSILKSRDITLSTKVHLVKVIVFPVVMFGCESWTIKKAERQRIDAFELWCWRRLLRVPWTARRSHQSILEDISPVYILWKDWCWSWSSNTLATWCEDLTLLKRPWCWERLKARGEGDDRGWDG